MGNPCGVDLSKVNIPKGTKFIEASAILRKAIDRQGCTSAVFGSKKGLKTFSGANSKHHPFLNFIRKQTGLPQLTSAQFIAKHRENKGSRKTATANRKVRRHKRKSDGLGVKKTSHKKRHGGRGKKRTKMYMAGELDEVDASGSSDEGEEGEFEESDDE